MPSALRDTKLAGVSPTPIREPRSTFARPTGLEPATLGFGADALPIELRARCHHGRKVRGEQEKEKEKERSTIPLDSGACGTIGNEQPIINYFSAVFPRIAPRV